MQSLDQGRLVDQWQEFAGAAAAKLQAVEPGAWVRPTGYAGWTAHDLLAHISSVQRATPRLVESAFSEAPIGPTEPFDEDRWNASQLRRRRDQGATVLIEELQQGVSALTQTLHARVTGPADLDRPVPAGAGRGRPLRDVLEELLEHQRHHLSDLLHAVHQVHLR